MRSTNLHAFELGGWTCARCLRRAELRSWGLGRCPALAKSDEVDSSVSDWLVQPLLLLLVRSKCVEKRVWTKCVERRVWTEECGKKSVERRKRLKKEARGPKSACRSSDRKITEGSGVHIRTLLQRPVGASVQSVPVSRPLS